MNDNRKIAILNQHDVIVTNIDGKDYAEDKYTQGGSKNRLELKFSNIYSYAKPGLTILHIEYGHEKNKPSGAVSLAISKRQPAAMTATYGLHVGNGLKVDGTLRLQSGEAMNNVSNDATLKAASSVALPTEKAVKAYVDQRLPAGVIVMWSGAVDKFPPGWALCDGKNGTPDLQNRFVLGAGKRKVNEADGEESITLSVDQMPSHNHSGNVSYTNTKPEYVTKKIYHAWNSNQQFSNNAKDATQTANVALNPAGKGQAHNNMPPYYVLAYIMKLP